MYGPDPLFNNPEPGLEGLYPEALLPVGRLAEGGVIAGKAATTGLAKFLGPKGPVFGNTYYRGKGNPDVLNHGPVRIGWSYNAKVDRLNFVLRIGKWHSDKYFNPISIKVEPGD